MSDSGGTVELCHRCHERPGTERFYVPTMRFSVSGAQLKFSAVRTIGCDQCWSEFQIEAHNAHAHTGRADDYMGGHER